MKVRDKRTYEIPLMTVSLVELEGAVCGSVVETKPQNTVETTGHEINEIDVANQEWNDGNWND